MSASLKPIDESQRLARAQHPFFARVSDVAVPESPILPHLEQEVANHPAAAHLDPVPRPPALPTLASRPDESGLAGDGRVAPATEGPAAALESARRLSVLGEDELAQRRLRAIPQTGATRAERVALSIEAARSDPEFQQEVALADAARDARDWARAEYLYWRALRLYPLHAGYQVQYAHVLKEQGKLQEAEVLYRSARALGAAPRDVEEHILHVQAILGHRVPLVPLPPAATHPLDLPPTRDEVEALFALLLHRPPESVAEVLGLLRHLTTCREVALDLVRRDAFRTANRELMILLSEQR